MRILLERINDNGTQTIGRMNVLDESGSSVFDCHTLELPWKDNNNNVSCIPVGEYKVVKRYSPKYGNHFHVTGVPGRSYILIHKGNYFTDIRGCILVGTGVSDINRDGQIDVTSSGVAMKELLKIMPKEFTLTILEK